MSDSCISSLLTADDDLFLLKFDDSLAAVCTLYSEYSVSRGCFFVFCFLGYTGCNGDVEDVGDVYTWLLLPNSTDPRASSCWKFDSLAKQGKMPLASRAVARDWDILSTCTYDMTYLYILYQHFFYQH